MFHVSSIKLAEKEQRPSTRLKSMLSQVYQLYINMLLMYTDTFFSEKKVDNMYQLPYRIYVINPVFLFTDITSTEKKQQQKQRYGQNV